MLFNSIDFAYFLPIVFALHWFVAAGRLKVQNILLLIASYYFYSCWDWRFMLLLMFSTGLDYVTGLQLSATNDERKRKLWLWGCISVNLGFLFVFKYYNFFIDSFQHAFSFFGITLNSTLIHVVLPVGISFYTFHGLSYVIDIYKRRITAEANFVNYALFVSFFPLLVAGPIERATHLLPQLKKPRSFNYSQATDGLRQILWGLFKKMVVAEHCAIHANQIFDHYQEYSGVILLAGAVFFAFQIYCDFSGYSDIALGTSRLFGIELLRNFAFPYFSRDIAEFWRRWHISLSSWFKDYLYIPLGGSEGGMKSKIRNTFIIFLVSGFWHGANWTFIVWGLLNALFYLPLLLINSQRKNMAIVAEGRLLPSIRELLSMGVTFTLVCLAWVFFRAESISHATGYLYRLATEFMHSQNSSFYPMSLYTALAFSLFFLAIEWFGRHDRYALDTFGLKWPTGFRWGLYALLIFLIFVFMPTSETPFIYFQF
jgi:D-alanyl-lipoteichoic acid acyltransferase DltB (MBOAT superfamily)